MSFHVGQKIVCVNTGDLAGGYSAWRADIPKEKQIYTVIGLYHFRNEPHVILAEIKNSEDTGFGYRARRFRPIVERKTDISIFTAMLNPSKRSVEA